MTQSGYPGYGKPNPGEPNPDNQSGSPQKNSDTSVLKTVLIILSVLFVVGVLLCGGTALIVSQAYRSEFERKGYSQDRYHMREVGEALLSYESAYKAFPPLKVADAGGSSGCSGAVLILPHMKIAAFNERIDFDNLQPWDTPGQNVWQEFAPSAFQSVRAKEPHDSNLSHVFFIAGPYRQGGPNTALTHGRSSQVSDCTDNAADTLMAIMLVEHSQPWGKPAALTPDEAFALIKQERKYKYFFGAMMDGSVRQIPTSISRSTFDALVSRDGGEAVNIESLQ